MLATWDSFSAKSTKIWDLEKGELLLTIPTGAWPRFSPDGKLVAVAGDDLRVWNVADRKEVRKISGYQGPVECVAFSPDGNVLAAGGHDREIRLWDPQTGKRLLTCVPCKEVAPYFLTFVEGGKSLLSAHHWSNYWNDESTVWDLQTGKEIKTWVSGRALRESNYGNRLLFLRGAFDPLSLKALTDFPRHLHASAVSPDGVHMAVAYGSKIRIWDRKKGVYCAVLAEHTGDVYSQSFSPDGKILASGSADGSIRLWDVAKAIGQNLDLKDE
jgi:WD40 repeat protein